MTAPEIERIARRQLAAYDARRPGELFADGAFALSLDDAYAVQLRMAALREARGEVIAGYKIGCISEAVQRQLQVGHPVFGHLFASEVYGSGAELDLAAFDSLAIEGELAVRVGGVPADGTVEIEAAFAVIELHNHVFRGPKQTAAELVANNAFHAGIVRAAAEFPLPGPDDEIAVYRNSELAGTAAFGSIPGGPAESVCRIVEHVRARGGQIRPGQILLTGSPLPLYPVKAGDEIVVRSARAGEVRATISRAR